jgi:CheY-like chemotaxis protein
LWKEVADPAIHEWIRGVGVLLWRDIILSQRGDLRTAGERSQPGCRRAPTQELGPVIMTMPARADEQAVAVTVLSLEPHPPDAAALRDILTSPQWPLCPGWKWNLEAALTPTAALTAIREAPVHVVVCGCDSQPGTWKEMLRQFPLLANPPLLIVTSRLADDYLWVEALNLGAYDVLAKPFDHTEVVRTVSRACLHWRANRGTLPESAPTPKARATSSGSGLLPECGGLARD